MPHSPWKFQHVSANFSRKERQDETATKRLFFGWQVIRLGSRNWEKQPHLKYPHIKHLYNTVHPKWISASTLYVIEKNEKIVEIQNQICRAIFEELISQPPF